MDAIRAVKLTKSYGKARGIVDLDLTVAEGEFFGFIGPNGAGKSTTIRTLLGLIKPTGGSASVLGFDILKDKLSILKNVGYLPSEGAFYPGMRVRDAIKFSSDLRRSDSLSEARVLCDRLELDMSRKVEELSFGNKKKVAIVCALAHRPKLLILDEPTSGLDPLMQKEFFDILKERHKEGSTIFLSSHVLTEIQHYCNRAAIIRDGRIIALDRVEALTKTNAKRITLKGSVDLGRLSGVRDLSVTDDSTSFLFSGSTNSLVRFLSTFDLSDLTITEPDLEEIFLHYYERGE
ncbi:ABC transporter ATP-binding protein [Guggenheimella bovis]